ncbi:MAG: 30S ribosomal protein S8 [Candidatus Pacebacteria bacterium]|jgi:small subunit ribosomal protein S8|nr:30S ribosomal protein S8 [Candidatus Paceibacterota bacterium]
MVMTDPIADFLTRIRNALKVKKKKVEAPYSKMKLAISKILKEKELIQDFKIREENGKKFIVLTLKYDENGEPLIENLVRVSKPGRRVYMGYRDFKPVRSGFGFRIVSTSRGVMTDIEAKRRKLGGEVICEIY